MKNLIIEHLTNNNSIEFNKVVREELEKRLVRAARKLTESTSETEVLTSLQVAAKGFGSDYGTYSTGVASFTLRSKLATTQFCEYLDNSGDVEDYEVHVLFKKPIEGYEDRDSIDFEDITDDTNFSFEFIVYLNSDLVSYNTESDDTPKLTNLFGDNPEVSDDQPGWNKKKVILPVWQPWMS